MGKIIISKKLVFRSAQFLMGGVVFSALLLSGCQRGEREKKEEKLDALGWGFKFATAIHTDKKDQAKAQEKVVIGYIYQKKWKQAEKYIPQIEGWRRSVAAADLAAAYAKESKQAEAEQWVEKAEEWGNLIKGWQKERIRAHLASANALVGKSKDLSHHSKNIQDKSERYKALLSISRFFAAQGDLENALKNLEELGKTSQYDEVLSLTMTYLEIAGMKVVREDKEKQKQFLDGALKSTKEIRLWIRAKFFIQVAIKYWEAGCQEEATQVVELADKELATFKGSARLKAPLLAELAAAYFKFGQNEKVDGILQQARALLPDEIDTIINEPKTLASIAWGYYECEREEEAWKIYEEAVIKAGKLTNSRPRALAMVEICCRLGQNQAKLSEAFEARLKEAYQNLGDPW